MICTPLILREVVISHHKISEMKKSLLLLLLFGIWGCATESEFTWLIREYEGEKCAACPIISVSIPEAADTTGLALTINRSIQEEVITALDFDDAYPVRNIQEAMDSFGVAFRDLKAQFPDEQMDWEAQIVGEVTYEDARVISIKLDTYTFTGGAHGLSFSHYLNFDKAAGEEHNVLVFFSNVDGLEKMAESEFRKRQQIPLNLGINDTGFMFEGDQFYLPENMGFTFQGLELIYNTYEVASYADGEIRFTLPWDQIKGLLQPDFLKPADS